MDRDDVVTVAVARHVVLREAALAADEADPALPLREVAVRRARAILRHHREGEERQDDHELPRRRHDDPPQAPGEAQREDRHGHGVVVAVAAALDEHTEERHDHRAEHEQAEAPRARIAGRLGDPEPRDHRADARDHGAEAVLHAVEPRRERRHLLLERLLGVLEDEVDHHLAERVEVPAEHEREHDDGQHERDAGRERERVAPRIGARAARQRVHHDRRAGARTRAPRRTA
ncbi:MAG: hypothetical protein M5U28_53085 [Sandaracinaceae bacterium]|nr:hypothetical protein [Sandaracinaceae bacterium]